MLEVKIEHPSKIDGYDAKYSSDLVMIHNGKEILRQWDNIEPEDVKFTRDLSWVKEAIELAYRLGSSDTLDDVYSPNFIGL